MADQLPQVSGEPDARTMWRPRVKLAVSVADSESAMAAIEAGADRIDLAAEISQGHPHPWSMKELPPLVSTAHQNGAEIGLRTPRITPARQWAATRWMLDRVPELGIDAVLAHHLGTLQLARQYCPDLPLIADFGFNCLNSGSARLLGELGATRVTVSNEAGIADLKRLTSTSPLPLEILVHGPITGMLLEHCLIAMYISKSGQRDVCRGPCRHVAFGLRDQFGQVRHIIADQYCRNHLLTGHDLATLPVLEKLVFPSVHSIRIEAQFYDADLVRVVTEGYRIRLNLLSQGETNGTDWPRVWEDIVARSPRPMNLGPYPRSVVSSRSTVAVMRELAET